MKIFLKFLIVLFVALPSTLMALEVGKWSFEKADEYCYIGSLATESDLPSDKKRGNFYILVYKNIGNPGTTLSPGPFDGSPLASFTESSKPTPRKALIQFSNTFQPG